MKVNRDRKPVKKRKAVGKSGANFHTFFFCLTHAVGADLQVQIFELLSNFFSVFSLDHFQFINILSIYLLTKPSVRISPLKAALADKQSKRGAN